jgi:hypothetical protein
MIEPTTESLMTLLADSVGRRAALKPVKITFYRGKCQCFDGVLAGILPEWDYLELSEVDP